MVVPDTPGEPLDFEEVYRRHADSVYRFCLVLLREPGAAEDLAADVFASAYAAYRTAAPDEGGVRAWLFRIARNAAIDRARRGGRLRRLLPLLAQPANHHDVERTAEIRHDLRTALDAIARLPARDRMLVGLRIGAGLGYAEVGTVAGMSENAARMATSRALQRVRQEVEHT